MEKVECAVIGAGIVGLAVARRLAASGREVVILEAEDHFGAHTSSRNSEVIHAGIYYPTGSLKARLCVAGRHALYRYCAERGVPHERIGKVIVACDDSERPGLEKYRRQAEINGVDDLRGLSADELATMEPAVRCVAGLLSPSTGIVDSHALMLHYLGDAESRGAVLALRAPVVSGSAGDGAIRLEVGGTEGTSLYCNSVVNCAGLHAQAVARTLAGVPPQTIPATHYAIGHYYVLSGPSPFRRLVYPVARPDWLGVHVTLDLGGRVRFGPDFRWIDRVDYRFDESCESSFYRAIRRYYPGLKDGALTPGYTGIRPRIDGPEGPTSDFVIQGPADHGVPGLVNLYGIESPGLTSSLAIADYVAGLLAI